jgi:hypothetical protein
MGGKYELEFQDIKENYFLAFLRNLINKFYYTPKSVK